MNTLVQILYEFRVVLWYLIVESVVLSFLSSLPWLPLFPIASDQNC